MPRPRKCRRVCAMPDNLGFMPVRAGDRPEAVILNVDEFETLRLIDREGLNQEQCGAYMGVARTTVQQIYTSARKKLADALVEARPLRIEGGHYQLCGSDGPCAECHSCWRNLSGRERKKEEASMKIAVPLDENQVDVCPVLARAPYFLLQENDKREIRENPASQAQGGAGLKAAQFLVDNEVDVILTPRCGQNSADVFEAAQMQIYKTQPGTAEENLQAFQQDKLERLTHFHAGFQGIQ